MVISYDNLCSTYIISRNFYWDRALLFCGIRQRKRVLIRMCTFCTYACSQRGYLIKIYYVHTPEADKAQKN